MPVYLKKEISWLLVLLLAVAVNFSGINVAFFTDDPGLYAALAKNMVLRGNYWELFSYGKDWLDKPHFPFWMAALSFKIFGFATWSYKLPALFFFLLSGLYTYLFAEKNYDRKTGFMAVLVLFSAQHILMSNTDVRAEPYLMALVIGSVYHFSKIENKFTWLDLILGSLLAGCAVMTKGIFALIPIGASVIGELLLKKRCQEIFRLKWLLAIMLTVVFVLPEFYSLYLQFDSQPGKNTFQNTNISGIHWFLWDSQFGRFINNGPITRKPGSIFFYFHTLIWAFAPWFFMLAYAVFTTLKKVLTGRPLPEYYTLCGAFVMWLIFSLSSFQLPFYTNIIYPFFAVITAAAFRKAIVGKRLRFFRAVQVVQTCILFLAVLVFNYFLRPPSALLFFAGLIAFAAVVVLLNKKTFGFTFVFLLSCCATLFVNFYLNTVFYPLLTSYKADVQAPVYINQKLSGKPVYVMDSLNNAFQFYCRQPVRLFSDKDHSKPLTQKIIYTDAARLKNLQKKHTVEVLEAVKNYPNEIIYKQFIWYQTREQALDQYYIIRY